jgi:PIN domain nuclease of toxin-antitoxin system
MNSSPNGGARRSASSCVLDASALLAVAFHERGEERVIEAIAAGAAMSTVNFAEAVTRLVELGLNVDETIAYFNSLEIEFVLFTTSHARQAGLLRAPTRRQGLSLGDRACLATARELGLPALTADRNWLTLDVGISIELCR